MRAHGNWQQIAARANFFQQAAAVHPEAQPNGTRVTSSLDGENIFLLKVMTLFVSADRLMGPHLEQGLAGLKAAAGR